MAQRIEGFFVRNYIWLVAINTVGCVALFVLLLIAVDRGDRRGQIMEEETETEVVNHTEVTTEEENKEEFNQDTPEEAFIANPYEDRKKRLSETLRKFYPNDSIEIEQMDEQSVVCYCYSYALEKSLFYKIGYTADGTELVGAPVS